MTIRTRAQDSVSQDDVDTVSMEPFVIEMVLQEVEALYQRCNPASQNSGKVSCHD